MKWPHALALGVTSWLGALAIDAATAGPKFKVTLKNPDDSHGITPDKDKVLFAFKGPGGICQAVIERQDEAWPRAIVIRLHQTGLESFRAENGKVSLHAAVAVQEGKIKARLWKDRDEKAGLDSKSPFWMEIRVVGADGKPATKLPLKGGWFEMQLPPAFLEGNPKSITLNWIDFYR
jgi:hypothetical protein